MKNTIESKTTLKGLLGRIISQLIWKLIVVTTLYLAVAHPNWFTSEYPWSVWTDLGPVVKWIIIVCDVIALVCLLRSFLYNIIYAPTTLLCIDENNDGTLTFTTSYKSFFGFSYVASTIVHKLLSVNVTQGYFGKIYDTGNVIIKVSAYNNTATKEHEFSINGVEGPFSLKGKIQEIVPVANDKLNIQEC